MNLLIVDDEIVAVKGMLDGIDKEACGIKKIWTAYNAENALNILRTQDIDIMLCDIEMPGASGIELLKKMRDEQKETACIFLTCHAKFEYAQEAIALGCKGYILKPAPYDEITDKIKSVKEEILNSRKRKSLEKYHITEEELDKQAGVYKETHSVKEIVAKVEEYITLHISDSELMVTDIADNLFLNKDYVNRVFKKEKGVSISQFLIQERMKLAGLLLEDVRIDVNLVAEKAGYSNYPYFSSSFKRYYGCSPSQYQKDRS